MIGSGADKKWYVFYVYPKFEVKVHDYLQKEDFESFLPLTWVVRHWSDRRKRMRVPLFPSYIFVNIERDRIHEVTRIPKVIRCVTFNGIPASLKQKEIDCIKQIIANEFSFEVVHSPSIGDHVMIVKGALTGMEGVLVEERGDQRFALRLELLQQSILINVPSDCLEYLEALV